MSSTYFLWYFSFFPHHLFSALNLPTYHFPYLNNPSAHIYHLNYFPSHPFSNLIYLITLLSLLPPVATFTISSYHLASSPISPPISHYFSYLTSSLHHHSNITFPSHHFPYLTFPFHQFSNHPPFPSRHLSHPTFYLTIPSHHYPYLAFPSTPPAMPTHLFPIWAALPSHYSSYLTFPSPPPAIPTLPCFPS